VREDYVQVQLSSADKFAVSVTVLNATYFHIATYLLSKILPISDISDIPSGHWLS